MCAAIRGMRIISDQTLSTGQRFFLLGYRQPVDHRRPARRGYFEQRLSLLHVDADRPMVLHTTGYNVPTFPFLIEPARLLSANQVSKEQRYFLPSRPSLENWDYLTIWQAATDHHRLIDALRSIYAARWVSTGASKGGMTAVYHRRFYPRDVDGTVAYVAPNDVNDVRDVYVPFIQRAGNDRACNAALRIFQRTTLERRPRMLALLRALEAATLDTPFVLSIRGRLALPQRADADRHRPAAVRLHRRDRRLDLLLRPGPGTVRAVLLPSVAPARLAQRRPDPVAARPAALPQGRLGPGLDAAVDPAAVQPYAMRDIDRWVRRSGRHLLFGENDPWSAEPFILGRGTRDSASYYADEGNHGADIAALNAADEAAATRRLARWSGVAMPPPAIASRSAGISDDTEVRRQTALRP